MYTAYLAGGYGHAQRNKRFCQPINNVAIGEYQVWNTQCFWEWDGLSACPEKRTGGVVLGGGFWSLTLPAAEEDYWEEGMLVGIDKDNMIQKYEEGQELIAGDVLFVYYDTDNHLSAKGMPHVRVSLAYEDLWNDAGWLREYLWDRRFARNNIFRDGIPMVIKRIVRDENGIKCFVAYPQPSSRKLEGGTEVCCNILGEKVCGQDCQGVILRAGGYMFLVEGNGILPGFTQPGKIGCYS